MFSLKWRKTWRGQTVCLDQSQMIRNQPLKIKTLLCRSNEINVGAVMAKLLGWHRAHETNINIRDLLIFMEWSTQTPESPTYSTHLWGSTQSEIFLKSSRVGSCSELDGKRCPKFDSRGHCWTELGDGTSVCQSCLYEEQVGTNLQMISHNVGLNY